VANCTGLENLSPYGLRGFESHLLRPGEVPEWLNGQVSKTLGASDVHASSNLALAAYFVSLSPLIPRVN
jgi:hypothetical protein